MGDTFPVGDVPTVNSGERMTPGAAGELLWLPPSIGGHMGWGAGHASL